MSTSTSATTTASTSDPSIGRILNYWLSGPAPEKRWFGGGPQVDAEIKDQFGSLISQARASQLHSWTTSPNGTLALIILLDQFSRNVFRGTPEMYSADPMALDIATRGIAQKFDRQVEVVGQSFFYLPFMHDESLGSQVAAVVMYESLAARCDAGSELKESAEKSAQFSERHLQCILKFGRFPSRNEILRRESTPEEIEYLKEYPNGVIRASNDLALDFGRVTTKNATVVSQNLTVTDWAPTTNGPVIIAGTIGKSSLIDSLVSGGKLDVSSIKGQWESFQTQIIKNPIPGLDSALVIAGADKRGTIYGIYDISEQIGVSPWYWFADVATPQQNTIYALDVVKIQGPPSVKYRGIFLNDEQPSLTNYVNEKYGAPGYVSKFYIHVFELLLRLRANYLWPTMWDSMFALDDKSNQQLADMYGIVMGTSHTEPLMRSTKEQTTYVKGGWDWTKNKNAIVSFLTDGVKRAKGFESLYTMGMRGSGDTASPTLTSSSLQDVVASQESILSSVLGANASVPKMWCLYKEVGGYYQKGLRVPDDITLLWSDDNNGNMQRLPIPSEVTRTAGAGVYYHFDYVGDPRNTKWINTISPQKTWQQMHLTYNLNATEIWIVNVGDLKPLEIPINHFLDMAYDMSLHQFPTSVQTWMTQWATREFGSSVAASTVSVIDRYGRYAARRKYELLDATIYSVTNYNESDRVQGEWKTLVSDAQAIYDSLPTAAQPSFFELVLHPATAGSILYDLYISTAKNNLYSKQGRASTATYGDAAKAAFAADSALAKKYHQLLGGKWNHMMDQTHIGYTSWQQPNSNVMPSVSYPTVSRTALPGIYIEGGSTTNALPPMDPYGVATRWLDIYSKSNSTATFTVTSDPWITLSPSSGTLSPSSLDQRVLISVSWANAPAGTSTSTIHISAGTSNFTATLPLSHNALPSNFTGFVVSDNTLTIEPSHFSTSDPAYAVIPGYGKTLSGLTLLPISLPTQTPPNSPKLTYSFYSFASSSSASITVTLSPSLNHNPSRPLAYAVAINNAAPTTCRYVPVTDLGTLPTGWAQAVEDAGWKYTSTKHAVGAGENVLNLWLLEPGVVVQRITVDFGGGVRTSYLGPPESMRIGMA